MREGEKEEKEKGDEERKDVARERGEKGGGG